MAVHISEMNIGSYRGLQDVKVSNLGDFNIVLGDNNGGKTSLLEVISVLSSPMEFRVWLWNVVDRCDKYSTSTIYRDFLQIFNYGNSKDNIKCSYRLKSDDLYSISISQNIEDITIRLSDIKQIDNIGYMNIKSNLRNDNKFDKNNLENIIVESSVNHFIFNEELNSQYNSLNYDIYDFSRKLPNYSASKEHKLFSINTAFLPYLSSNVINFNKIINNNEYHNMLVNLLKHFDESINDFIVSPDNNHQYMLRTSNFDKPIPLTCFGDGVRQAISIFAYMIMAENGILLIDEFDSAVHAHKMSATIELIIAMCKKMNIQLFISTHNAEAIKKFLEGTKEYIDESRILRLRKLKEGRIICKTINGTEALENIKNLGMEYRI